MCVFYSWIRTDMARKHKAARKKKSARRNRQAARHQTTSRPGLEALDPRILLDASGVLNEVVEVTSGIDLDGVHASPRAADESGSIEGQHTSVSKSFRSELVFIDAGVDGQEALLSDLRASRPGILREVVLLDATRDGLEQIADAVQGRADIDAIHIVSHGETARLNLGSSRITTEQLANEYASTLDRIGQALSDGADILVYGCDVGAGSAGNQFVNTFSQATGADVAASDDVTGPQSLDGDFDLEVNAGTIETAVAFSPSLQDAFPSTLALTGFIVEVGSDGTASFDADNSPGNDSGPNNGIIRSHDLITFNLDFATNNGGATNPIIRSTLPAGLYWDVLPAVATGPQSGIFDSVTGAPGGDGRTLVMHMTDIGGALSTSIPVQAKALGYENGTPLNDVQFFMSADGEATIASQSMDFTMSSAPFMDLVLKNPSFVGVFDDAAGTRQGAAYAYSVGMIGNHPTRSGTDSVKGSAPVQSSYSFDVDLSGVSPGAEVFTWGPSVGATRALDGAYRNYEFVTTNLLGWPVNAPTGKTDDYPSHSYYVPERSTADSGDFTVGSGTAGGLTTINVTGADTDGPLPTENAWGSPLPAGESWFSSGVVVVWVPIEDIQRGQDGVAGTNDDGVLDISPAVTNFDPDDFWNNQNNYGTGSEPTANNSHTHTVESTRVGGHTKALGRVGEWNYVETATYWHAGDGVTSSGHQYEVKLSSGRNEGVLPISGIIYGEKFDNSSTKITPIANWGASGQHGNVSNSNWSRAYINYGTNQGWRQYGTDYIVEFGTGGVAGDPAGWTDWDSMGDSTLSDTDTSTVWSEDPTDPALGGTADPDTGVRDSITKWRVKFLHDLEPGENLEVWVGKETIGRSTLDPTNNPGGNIIGDTSAYTADFRQSLSTLWVTSEYDPATNGWNSNGTSSDFYRGDRLRYVDAVVRIDKEVVDTGSGTNFLGGSAATFKLTSTVTTPGPESGEPARDVVVSDILPGDLTIVPNSVSPISANGNPVEYCIVCDGSDWTPYYPLVGLAKGVRWNYGDVPLNTALPDKTFEVLIPFDAPNGTQYENTATISSPSDPSELVWRDSQAGLTAVQIAALSVNKTPLTPLVAENSKMIYEIGVANVSDDKVIPFIDTVDLLPWDGDEDGSSFSGRFTDINITGLDSSLDIYVTAESPTTLDNQDATPNDGFADPGKSTDAWYVAPGTGIWQYTLDDVRNGVAGAPSIGSLTAIRVVSNGTLVPQLPASMSTSWNLELTPVGNSGLPGDQYVNDLALRTDPSVLVEPTFSGPATIRVVAPDIEVTKEVCVEDTACDPEDDAHWTDDAEYTDDPTPTWRIVATNTGTSDLVDVTVTDPSIPTGMTYVAGSAQASSGNTDGFVPTWTLSLVPGDSQYLTFDTQATGIPAGGDFENAVSVNAQDQFAQTATANDSAKMHYTPEIGVSKSQVQAVRNATNPDIYDVTYRVTIANTGLRELVDLELTEDLHASFGPGFVGVGTPAPRIVNSSLSTGASLPLLNGFWDGNANGLGNAQMLDGASGLLAMGDSVTLEYVVQVDPTLLTDPANTTNQVVGSSNGGEATDSSDNGTDPDSDNGAGGTDDPTPLQITDIRVAKQVNGPYVDNNNGTWTIPYQLVLENTGTGTAQQPNLTDNIQAQLGTDVFNSVQNVALNTAGVIGGTAPQLAGTWNGTTGASILDGTGSLAPKDKLIVTFDVVVNGSALASEAPLTNQAQGSVQDSTGASTTDLSDDGSDPRTDNPTAPGDNGAGGTNDPTPIQIPDVALAKQVVGTPVQLANGNWSVEYQLVLQNVGTVDLTNLQITENLEAEFGEGVYVSLITPPAITTSVALSGSTDPVLNGGWDGGLKASGNESLLNGGSGRLVPNDRVVIRFTIEVNPDASGTSSSMDNQASASATDANGTIVRDQSDSGADPNSNNTTSPGDTGGPDDATPLTLPEVGTAKRVSGDYTNNGDGTWTIPYEIVLENTGTATLTDLRIADDIRSQLGLSVFNSVRNVALDVSGVSGGVAPGLNTGWSGDNTANALDGTGSLAPGDSVKLSFDLIVNGSALAAASPLTNQATGSATGPSGSVSDLSDDGTDPSTDNSTAPGDNGAGGTNDPTPILLPNIGLAKQVIGSPTQMANGNWLVNYQMVLQNTGTVDLTNLQISENLEIEFGKDVFVGVVTSPAITGPSMSGSFAPTLNASWDGGLNASSNLGIFNGSSGKLVPGDTVSVTLSVEVNPDASGQSSPLTNQADASGVDPDGKTVTDASDAGSDPNNGENDPTPLRVPEVGVAKQVNNVNEISTGIYEVTYAVVVENVGTIDLVNLQVTEDMSAEFGSGFGSVVSGVTIVSTDATTTPTLSSPAWDGVTNQNFFDGSSGLLKPGESVTVNFTIRADTNQGDTTPPVDWTNQVSAYGQSTEGAETTDLSDDGTNPNTDNGGGTTDDPSPFETPAIRSGKTYGTIVPNADGTYTVPVVITVSNTGTSELTNLSLMEDLADQYGDALISISNAKITANGVYTGVLPVVNSSWASDTSRDAIDPVQSNESLPTGESFLFTFDAIVDPDAVDDQSQALNNQAVVSGEGKNYDGTVVRVNDQSGFPTAVDQSGNDNDNASTLLIPEIRTTKEYKSAVANATNSDNWDVTFDLVLENTGSTDLSGIDLHDDFAMQWGDVFKSVVNVTINDTIGVGNGSPPTLNYGATAGATPYDGGVTSSNLLNNDGLLKPGEYIVLTVTVTVDPDASGESTVMHNQTQAAGDGPDGVEVTDLSDSGTNPNTTNPTGDGDSGGSNDPTPVALPDVAVTKEVHGTPTELPNGNYEVTYRLVIENTGALDLTNLQLEEDMIGHFGPEIFLSVISPPAITVAPTDPGSTSPSLGSWDGVSDIKIFNGTSGTLVPGDGLEVEFSIEVDVSKASRAGLKTNQVRITADNSTGTPVTDDSDAGTDPNGTNPDAVGDKGTSNDPTPLQIPRVGLAKQVSGAYVDNHDGTYTVPFELIMTNTGTVDLARPTLIDNIQEQLGEDVFARVHTITLDTSGVTNGTAPNLNTAWAGDSTDNVLDGTGTLAPQDTVIVRFQLVVNGPELASNTPLDNQANASGQDVHGTIVSDMSDDGVDPDGSNAGWPGDNGSGGTDDPTPIQIPRIGLAKEVVGKPVELANGNFSVVYQLVLQNTGTVNLTNVQIAENLESEFGSGVYVGVRTAPSITVAPRLAGSVAPVLDSDWDAGLSGSSRVNIFDGVSGTLVPNDSLTITFQVEVNPDANGPGGALHNTAVASGSDANGTVVSDDSDDGYDPNGANPTADGDQGTSDDPTPLNIPDINIAKTTVGAPLQTTANRDHYNVTYELVTENTGNMTLTGLDLYDDIAAQFGDAFVAISGSPMITGNTLADAANLPTINSGWDSDTSVSLFNDDGSLAPGETITIRFVVTVDSVAANREPLENQATIVADDPDTGSESGPRDLSDSGVDTKGTNPGEAGDNGTSDDKTPVTLPDATIGLAKRVTNVEGTTFTMEFVVENLGNVDALNVTLVDNFDMVFGAGNYDVDGIQLSVPPTMSGSSITVNSDFDGSGDSDMLTDSGNTLVVGDRATITVTATLSSVIDPDGPGPLDHGEYENTGTTTSEDVHGNKYTDESQDGSDPDPDGDGNGKNNNDPTPVNVDPKAPVEIVKDATVDGDTITYTIVISNTGNSIATEVSIQDNLDDVFGPHNYQVENTSMTVAPQMGASSLTLNPNYSGSNGSTNGVSHTNLLDSRVENALAHGDSATFTVTVKVLKVTDPDLAGPLVFGEYDNTSHVSNKDVLGRSYADDDPALSTPIDPTADIAIEKTATAIGEDTVEFELHIVNNGNSLADKVSIVDDLDSVFGAGHYVINGIRMAVLPQDVDSSLSVNLNYTGGAGVTGGVPNNEVLNTFNNNTLDVGDSATFQISVTVNELIDQDGEGPMPLGEFLNLARVSNEDPTNDRYTDTDDGDVAFTPDATVGVAKEATWNDTLDTVTYTFHLEHFGNTQAVSLSMMEDLDAIFGAGSYSVTAPTQLYGPSTLVLNSLYNGSSDEELFGSGSTLLPGEKAGIQIELTVHEIVDAGGDGLGTYVNQVTLDNEDVGGNPYDDESVDGVDPDPNGDGDPTEEGPTTANLTPDATVGGAKTATVNADSSMVTFDFYLEHFGNTQAFNVQLVEDLDEVFRSDTEAYSVANIVMLDGPSGVILNGLFDGSSQTNLLQSGSTMQPGETAHFQVSVALNTAFGLYENQAIVNTQDGNGTPYEDPTNNGTDPDPDGDGNPTNDNVPTPFAVASGELTGNVYVDQDGDGIFDDGELPIAGVVVTLTGTDINGDPVEMTTTTTADGGYYFENLLPGSYTVTQVHPEGFLDGIDTPGTAGGVAGNDVIDLELTPEGGPFNANDYNFGEAGVDPLHAGKDPFLASRENGVAAPKSERQVYEAFLASDGVNEKGDTVEVTGTDGVDNIRVEAGLDQHLIVVNGVGYSYDANTVTKIVVNGDGDDKIAIVGTSLDDQADMLAKYGKFFSQRYHISYDGMKEVRVHGGEGGFDKAIMADSAGNDVFVGSSTFASMREIENAYRNESRGFDVITGNSVMGGFDRAIVFGTSGSDHLRVLPEFAQLRRSAGNTEFRANRFERFQAKGAGGQDFAEFTDSAGNDRMNLEDHNVVMVGAGYHNTVTDFATVHARATRGGNDQATFFDSAGDDRYYVHPAKAVYMAGSNYENRIWGFDGSVAYANKGGHDESFLYDTPGDDVFVARPTTSLIRGTIDGATYEHVTHDFEVMTGHAKYGGFDAAFVHDGAGDDALAVRPDFVELKGAGDSFKHRVLFFETVVGDGSAGGNDTATFLDKAVFSDATSDDLFVSTSTRAYLEQSGTDFRKTADGYENVNVFLTSGDDTTELNEVLVSERVEGADSKVSVSGRSTVVHGMDRVKMSSKDGHKPTADINTVNYVFEQIGQWFNI